MDHYAVLGLQPGAPIEEIKGQFRRLVMVFHPDRNNDDVWCQEQIKRFNASYEFLADAARKADYDATFLKETPGPSLRQTAAPVKPQERSPKGRTNAVQVATSAMPGLSQRLLLSALFCAFLLGAAVVIGILLDAGQAADSPLPPPVVTALPPPALSPPPTLPAPAAVGGMGTSGPVTGGDTWPATMVTGDGGQIGSSGSPHPVFTTPESRTTAEVGPFSSTQP